MKDKNFGKTAPKMTAEAAERWRSSYRKYRHQKHQEKSKTNTYSSEQKFGANIQLSHDTRTHFCKRIIRAFKLYPKYSNVNKSSVSWRFLHDKLSYTTFKQTMFDSEYSLVTMNKKEEWIFRGSCRTGWECGEGEIAAWNQGEEEDFQTNQTSCQRQECRQRGRDDLITY